MTGVARKIRKWMVGSMIVATASLGVLGAGMPSAQAAGYSKTLTGNSAPQATVCAVNESRVTVGCVRTNGYGQYYITVSSGHHYYLYVWQQRGCNVYSGTTRWMWIADNAPNPVLISGMLWPSTFWYRAC